MMTKAALCIGINYTGTPNQLYGCNQDAIRMEKFLIEHKFDSITMLCDSKKEVPNTIGSPTSKNIANELNNLVNYSNKNPGSTIVLHYSGHGCNTRDRNGDEKDGVDEVICTLDGGIVDDYIFRNFIMKLHKDTKCFCLFDCCHSGTIMDLEYHLMHNRAVSENIRNKTSCDVVCISGCMDNQCSADSYDYKNKKFAGAMTNAFFNSCDENHTIEHIVQKMTQSLIKDNFPQKPQITMSKNDCHKKTIEHYFK